MLLKITVKAVSAFWVITQYTKIWIDLLQGIRGFSTSTSTTTIGFLQGIYRGLGDCLKIRMFL